MKEITKQIRKWGRAVKLLSAILVCMTVFAGCADSSTKTQSGTGEVQKQGGGDDGAVDLGELGFITEFVRVKEGRNDFKSAESSVTLLKNEKNDVYILMGFADGNRLVGDTFELQRLTDGFSARRLLHTFDGTISDDDAYFYIWDDSSRIHKYTVHFGQYSAPLGDEGSGEIIRENTVTSEEIEIPEAIVSFQTTKSGGNYALTDQGNVYAWDNAVDGKVGHDTPAKLPVSGIKDMCSLGDSSERVYLSDSGELYKSERTGDHGTEIQKLDDISDLTHIYPVDADDEVIGINSQSGIDVYYVGSVHTSGTTRVKQSSLSAVKAEKPLPNTNCCFYRKEADGVNNIWWQEKYYAFRTNDPSHGTEYYEYSHGDISLCRYFNTTDNVTTDIDAMLDYVSMYGDTWLDSQGTLYWYNSANPNDSYMIAENVRGYSIHDWQDYLSGSYAEAQFDRGAGMGRITFIYHKDGSVSAYCANQMEKAGGGIVDLDAEYYGNGTYGMLIPGENGRYRICDRMKEDGTYDVVAELELPE